MKKTIFYGLVLAFCLFAQLSMQYPFPQSVIAAMSTRQSRYHHYMWHQVREGWNRFPQSTKDAFAKIGWTPPHPARNYDKNGKASVILDNYSGEDFLFMHRQMLATVNDIIAQNNDPYGHIRGWRSIPLLNNTQYPVPPTYTIPNDSTTTASLAVWKADKFLSQIQAAEKTFTDPAQLRTMTLGELGAKIEGTIHQWMHMRWSSASPLGYRNSYKGVIPNIDKQWDNVNYTWLGDSYASHVHPIFYQLHGWIDARVEDWRKANNLSVITWKGNWTGGPMENLASVMKHSALTVGEAAASDHDSVGDVLEQAFQIFMKSGVPESSFADLDTTGLIPEPVSNTGKKLVTRKVCNGKAKSKKAS